VEYSYLEGDFDRVPRLTGDLPPLGYGVTRAFDRQPRRRESRFAFLYQGLVEVPETGVYTFWTASDDGSTLDVDAERVVDNDGLHSLQERAGCAALEKGWHRIDLGFFESSGGHALDVWWSGPGFERRPLRATDLRARPAPAGGSLMGFP
jgi:hypothetical protein